MPCDLYMICLVTCEIPLPELSSYLLKRLHAIGDSWLDKLRG